MIRRPPRSTLSSSSAASDVYKRQDHGGPAVAGAVRRRRAPATGSGVRSNPASLRGRLLSGRPRRVPGSPAGGDGRVTNGQDARGALVPPREDWPEPPRLTDAGAVLTDVVLTTFRLNARLMEIAQELAIAGDLTAAWWQVLGGVLDQPRSVAEIGRRMGMTRQGVQRVADLLVERGLAEYRPNPAHRRAKLLACTEAGCWAIRRISLVQQPFADRVGTAGGSDRLRTALATMQSLVAVLAADQPSGE